MLGSSTVRYACIFDKDGLLVDTESTWFEATSRLLSRSGFVHEVETHCRMMGCAVNVCIEMLHKRHPGFRVTRDQLFRSFHEVRKERGLCPMPGAERLLAVLHEKGIPMAVATSARREEAISDIEEMGWSGYFRAVVAAEDVVFHKPAPDVYFEAARRLKVDPQACVAYEDGVNGALSAYRAGMQVVFVRDKRFGVTPPREARLVVNNLNELMSS